MNIRFVLTASTFALAAFVAGPANASTSNFLGFHSFHEEQPEKPSHSGPVAITPWDIAPRSSHSTDFFTKDSPRVTFTDFGPVGKTASPVTDLSVTSAVPEPATWALFLFGFGAIGWMLRSARLSGAARGTPNTN